MKSREINKLSDLLGNNLKLVVCGTAAGNTSAQLKQYYAKRGNKFWNTLFQTGLTTVLPSPAEVGNLPEYGIGLTDLVKGKSGMDWGLADTDFSRDSLTRNLKQYQPRYLCFNGKRAAGEYFQHPVAYGVQPATVGKTAFFVAPSTSGAANMCWD